MGSWVETVVKLTPAFTTLVVGVIASSIAFLQHKTNRDKLRLDLFNKRFEAYEKLQGFFVAVMRDGRVKPESLQALSESRYKSRFLFGNEIEQYHEKIWGKSVDAMSLYSRLYDESGRGVLPVGAERNKVAEQESALVKWFTQQLVDSPKLYDRYLRFE